MAFLREMAQIFYRQPSGWLLVFRVRALFSQNQNSLSAQCTLQCLQILTDWMLSKIVCVCQFYCSIIQPSFAKLIMSVPFIQIGQCGNQIGSSFYDIMFEEGSKASLGHQALLSQFFTVKEGKKNKPHAFLIDMEPKVVNKNLAFIKNWQYDKKLSLVQEEGSGNNWAYGCNIHGNAMKSSLTQLFRIYAEDQDYIKCFVQLQSMAGGTGSGLGTFIIQLLSEMFPKTPKFVTCVMPHLSGEVILQSYNACLSLGTIYKESDGIFIVENDTMNMICTKDLKIAKPSLQDINEVIGRNLASVYFPVINKTTDKIYSIEQNGLNYGTDFIENLFYDNRYKLCSIKTAPHGPKDSQSFNFDSWQAVENDLLLKNRYKSKSSLLIMRGPDHQIVQNPKLTALYDKHAFYKYNRSGTLLDNGQHFVESLDKILERGYNMFKQSAYFYQYQKFGLEKEEMLECFAIIQNVQQCYKKL